MTQDELDQLIPPLDVYTRALCYQATPKEMAQVRRYLIAEKQFLHEKNVGLEVQEVDIEELEPSILTLTTQTPTQTTPWSDAKPSGNYGAELGQLGAIAAITMVGAATVSIVAAPIVLPVVAVAGAIGWLSGKLLGSNIKK